MKLQKVKYKDLPSDQKTGFIFQKISARLANYGYSTLQIPGDSSLVDFIARHADGITSYNVVIKQKLILDMKYFNKDIWIAGFAKGAWYIYSHDEVLRRFLTQFSEIKESASWKKHQRYILSSLDPIKSRIMRKYRV